MCDDNDLYMKYFNIRLSAEIDVLQLMDKIEELAEKQVLDQRMKMTGRDLALMVCGSLVEKPPKCPVCGHPMDMHVAMPASIFLDGSMSKESERHANSLICQVPNCPRTNGIQESCFSAIPDELIGNTLQKKPSILRRIWLVIKG